MFCYSSSASPLGSLVAIPTSAISFSLLYGELSLALQEQGGLFRSEGGADTLEKPSTNGPQELVSKCPQTLLASGSHLPRDISQSPQWDCCHTRNPLISMHQTVFSLSSLLPPPCSLELPDKPPVPRCLPQPCYCSTQAKTRRSRELIIRERKHSSQCPQLLPSFQTVPGHSR